MRRRWWVLATVSVSQLMIVLDVTVVTIALPSAQHDLHFSDSDRQWIVTAYALAFGSLLLIGGRLADRLGRKQTFLAGLVGFALASAVGGAASSFAVLVTARAVQGVFAALLAPASLAIVTTTFTEPRDRTKALGVFGAIAGAGAGVGLLLGGVLTEYASWRWTLLINLLFAGVAIAGALLLLGRQPERERPPLDWVGTVTVTLGLFGLVYGFSHAETSGWGNGVTVSSLVLAGALLVAFVAQQHRAAHPLMPLSLVVERTRGGSFLALLFTSSGVFAVFLFLTYYLQVTRGYSAVKSGLAFMPMIVIVVATAMLVSTVLLARISGRVLMPLGLAFLAGGLWVLTAVGLHTSYTSVVLPATALLGVGVGIASAAAVVGVNSGVAESDAGVTGALMNAVQQVGGSVGTALLNTIAATSGQRFARSHLPTSDLAARAAVHSYATVFAATALAFVAATVVTAVVLRPGLLEPVGEPEPLEVPASVA